MADIANWAESQLIRWLLTSTAVDRPTAWYVSLHTGDPGEDGLLLEVSGNGYARKSATFTESSNGLVRNDADLVFGPCVTTSWGSVTHVAVWDASTTGNCLYHGAMTVAVPISVGDSLKIAAGALDLSLD